MVKLSMIKLWSVVAGLVGIFTFSDTAVAQSSWNLSRDMIAGISSNPTGVWSFMENSGGAATLLPPPNYQEPCSNFVTNPAVFNCWVHVDVPLPVPPVLPVLSPIIGISSSETVQSTGPSFFELKQGMPYLHPGGLQKPAIISWTSPIAQTVAIMGSVSNIDGTCGDGIRFHIGKSISPKRVTKWINVAAGSSAVGVVPSISVAANEKIFFVVDAGIAGEKSCDSTTLDILIVKR